MASNVKLSTALLCLDCEAIYDKSDGKYCPQCGSKTAHAVAKWLPSMNLSTFPQATTAWDLQTAIAARKSNPAFNN